MGRKAINMNVNDLLELQEGDLFKVSGPFVTRDLIGELAKPTHFDEEPHIRGIPSIMSEVFGEDGVAFMCSAGTTTMLYLTLRALFYDVWCLDVGMEKMALNCESQFPCFNPECGWLWTMFIVSRVKRSKFGNYPAVSAALEFSMMNSRHGKDREVAKGRLLLQFVE